MNVAVTVDPLDAGRRALLTGAWAEARDAFALAVAHDPTADALDGLGRALWWLKDVPAAIEARTRSYTALRQAGRFGAAARVAVWLAREHRSLLHHPAVAAGWLARARTSAAQDPDGSARGWVLLAEAEEGGDGDHATALLSEAVTLARLEGDGDLEISALALLGVTEAARGSVDQGIARIDEAMAAATAGEGIDPQTIGEAFCAVMEVAGLLGESDRVAGWAAALERFRADHDFVPLVAYGIPATAADALNSFCGACCGGIYLVTGRLADAERTLRTALDDLRRHGMHSRCVHPASQLAELLVAQGRLEEAEPLLLEFADRPECARGLASLALARGETEEAASRLRSMIATLGDQTLVAFPLWALTVDAELARGQLDAAEEAATTVRDIAELTRSSRHQALATFAAAKVAVARGTGDARPLAREAPAALAAVDLPIDACRARLLYATSLVEHDRPAAIAEARAALLALDRLGAVADADRAAGFLKDLGVRGRTGPKDVGVLSRRQQQVLRLVAHGLTNGEIATRLDISVKTAGHHVSSILTRLGVRSRTEAAAWAMLHLPRDDHAP